MAFDGGFTSNIARELRLSLDCHIDKIYQPSGDELVFLLRKKGFAKRLCLSVRQGVARVHFTEHKNENPETPPMFCMLLRKHFSSAKIIDVKQEGFERLIEFTFNATNELGDSISPKIICELIGNKSNIILLNNEGKIIDALRRSDIVNDARLIQPGAVYAYPAAQDKLDLVNSDIDFILKKLQEKNETLLSTALLDTIGGLSPLVCREIAYRVAKSVDILTENTDFNALRAQLLKIREDFICGKPVMLLEREGTPKDFCFTEITQYENEYTLKPYPDFSSLLDAFYFEREQRYKLNRLSLDISKTLNNLILRAKRRTEQRKKELKECENREALRKSGELIKANLHLFSAGDVSVKVTDFYDENMADITIPLDPALSPANNAAKYFKEYKKSCTAAVTLKALLEKDSLELSYLESVAYNLGESKTAADIEEIRQELINEGYIRLRKNNKKAPKASAFKEYTTAEGYRLIVGKNNTQNDLLTTKTASKNDLWFHTKDIHGSHVVLLCEGKQVSDETLLFACSLAAANSKAKASDKVPVDYTRIRYVKKPAGAKAGMVIYTNQKTLYVTPYKEDN